jgi:hypothetical protein
LPPRKDSAGSTAGGARNFGHGSVPLRSNASRSLGASRAKVAAWQTPMRFERYDARLFRAAGETQLAEVAARYNKLLQPAIQMRCRNIWPSTSHALYSTLRTSISPNIIKGGYRSNVIPSEARSHAGHSRRADEDLPGFSTR